MRSVKRKSHWGECRRRTCPDTQWPDHLARGPAVRQAKVQAPSNLVTDRLGVFLALVGTSRFRSWGPNRNWPTCRLQAARASRATQKRIIQRSAAPPRHDDAVRHSVHAACIEQGTSWITTGLARRFAQAEAQSLRQTFSMPIRAPLSLLPCRRLQGWTARTPQHGPIFCSA